jgi:hypothetical protein
MAGSEFELADRCCRNLDRCRWAGFLRQSTNYLIDLKGGIMVDSEASGVGKRGEVIATRTMINRVEEKFSIKHQCLVGDTNYGVSAELGWHHNGTFSRSDLILDSENNADSKRLRSVRISCLATCQWQIQVKNG